MTELNLPQQIQSDLGIILASKDTSILFQLMKEYREDMIREALRVTVEQNQKKRIQFPLSYMDRLLANWDSRGFTTVEQVREAEAERQKNLSGETSNVPKWATEEVEELPEDPERTKKFIEILVSMHAKAKYGALNPTEAELEDCKRDIEKFRKEQMNAQRT